MLLKSLLHKIERAFGKLGRAIFSGAGAPVGLRQISEDPTNSTLHLANAILASRSGRPFLAYAELKSSHYLGLSNQEFEQHREHFERALPPTSSLNHNTYFRLSSLQREIQERGGNFSSYSVLDVGGGEGTLAAFIRDASYCLAEPTINGISGTALPFPDDSFDFVVSCHVLEHIPENERSQFLDQLLAKSTRGVILLNPFEVADTKMTERLKLIVELTGASWAKEHLECSLPRVADIQQYAAERCLEITVKPNGTMTTAMAFVFVDYFAKKSLSNLDLDKVTSFFNENFMEILTSNEYPNAYFIYIKKS
jgi:SAM-dependent methyltransferase